MTRPWDPLPFPRFGDSTEEMLFEALGRALVRWEFVDFSLSQVYSLFRDDPTWGHMREYGIGNNIFKDRLTTLMKAAEAWFTRYPNQQLEGTFQRLMEGAKGFADRRNEFAHGVVIDVRRFLFWTEKLAPAPKERPQFLLVPGFHVVRKHDTIGMPMFGYSHRELDNLSMGILELEMALEVFMRKLWPSDRPQPAEWQ